jgi:hypothetical protein
MGLVEKKWNDEMMENVIVKLHFFNRRERGGRRGALCDLCGEYQQNCYLKNGCELLG